MLVCRYECREQSWCCHLAPTLTVPSPSNLLFLYPLVFQRPATPLAKHLLSRALSYPESVVSRDFVFIVFSFPSLHITPSHGVLLMRPSDSLVPLTALNQGCLRAISPIIILNTLPRHFIVSSFFFAMDVGKSYRASCGHSAFFSLFLPFFHPFPFLSLFLHLLSMSLSESLPGCFS